MRSFELPERFSLAATLMDSTAHLEPGGLYVIEMAHPSNHFQMRSTTQSTWTLERDGIKVTTSWVGG